METQEIGIGTQGANTPGHHSEGLELPQSTAVREWFSLPNLFLNPVKKRKAAQEATLVDRDRLSLVKLEQIISEAVEKAIRKAVEPLLKEIVQLRRKVLLYQEASQTPAPVQTQRKDLQANIRVQTSDEQPQQEIGEPRERPTYSEIAKKGIA